MEPQAALVAMLSGHLVTLAISLATRLGIPELVAHRPRRLAALARATRSHPDTLYRVLRALATAGVLAEHRGRRFGRTPLSDLLCRGVPGSLRAPALLAGESWRRVTYDLPAAVRTGRSPFPRVLGDDFYAYLARHPARYRLFLDAMEYHWPELARAVVRAGRLTHARSVVDVGGGPAALMQVILKMNPAATGVVLEAPAAAARARRSLVAAGLGRRCRVVSGDFFRRVPRGGDPGALSGRDGRRRAPAGGRDARARRRSSHGGPGARSRDAGLHRRPRAHRRRVPHAARGRGLPAAPNHPRGRRRQRPRSLPEAPRKVLDLTAKRTALPERADAADETCIVEAHRAFTGHAVDGPHHRGLMVHQVDLTRNDLDRLIPGHLLIPELADLTRRRDPLG